MRIASIDVGTNTLLLLIADVNGDEIFPIHNEQVIARLGKGIDSSGLIRKEAFDKVADALLNFKARAQSFNVEKIVAVGTSALRDAKNKIDFLKFIEGKTGIKIKVISGAEEARLTYLGAVSGLGVKNSKISVIDIGGGSTEIITGVGYEVKKFASLNIGTVRLTEKFLKHSPPLDEEINEVRNFLNEQFEKIDKEFDFSGSRLVGVAATVTTIASYDLKLEKYDGEKVNGHKMTFETISKIYETFKGLSVEEIRKIPQVSSGREDVIFAGILILFEFMRKFNFTEITASDRGLRYGVIFDLIRTNSL
jgi:exopolyphosphatase / guanosine-5'-triphosphate,3'-diphosphate pyrophosphatase